jgi:hypothetical protein
VIRPSIGPDTIFQRRAILALDPTIVATLRFRTLARRTDRGASMLIP